VAMFMMTLFINVITKERLNFTRTILDVLTKVKV